ncbi:MAG: hypothetical protein IJN92_11860 [Lachnospiraceae bacterium]|nr:hypothetical protein [Lachnospiraceae bacterium]
MKRILKKTMLLSLILATFLLVGCSNIGDITQNTIIVNKDGSILGVIVEEFGDSKYVSDELKAMVEEEVATYNSGAGEDKITLQSYEITEEGQAKVVLKYASSDDYKEFNEENTFAGTVSEAYDAGYEFADMRSVAGDGQVLEKADVLEKGTMKIAIFQENVNIRVNGKIVYVSSGVNLVDKKEATSTDADESIELFYVIYE